MSVDALTLGGPTSGPSGLPGLANAISSFASRISKACRMPDSIEDKQSYYVIENDNVMLNLQKIDPDIVKSMSADDSGKFVDKLGRDYYFSKFVLLKGQGDSYYLASLNSLQNMITLQGNRNNTSSMIGRNHEDVSRFARKNFGDELLDPYAGGNIYYNPQTCVLHLWGESGAYNKLSTSGAHIIIRSMMSKLGIKVSFDPPFNVIR